MDAIRLYKHRDGGEVLTVRNIFYLKSMKHLRPLILNGTIRTFQDLFDHVTEQDVADVMGCGVKQVRAIRKDCSRMRLGELFGLSEGVGVDYKRVADLFVE